MSFDARLANGLCVLTPRSLIETVVEVSGRVDTPVSPWGDVNIIQVKIKYTTMAQLEKFLVLIRRNKSSATTSTR